MSPDPSPHSSAEDLLQAFAVNSMTVDNLVVAFVEAERALLQQVQARAKASAQGVDTTDLALKLGGERLQLLVQMHEKLGRTLRMTIALKRRIETGWPRRGEADDRRSMARRQVERAVSEQIRAAVNESPERLLRELHERLWDPGVEAMLDTMPVEDVIAAIAREFAAVKADVDAWVRPAEQATGKPSDNTPPLPEPEEPPDPAPFQEEGVLEEGEPHGEIEEPAPEPQSRPWPKGMVNPPPHPYQPWSPEYEKYYRRRGKLPDD